MHGIVESIRQTHSGQRRSKEREGNGPAAVMAADASGRGGHDMRRKVMRRGVVSARGAPVDCYGGGGGRAHKGDDDGESGFGSGGCDGVSFSRVCAR
jgi:hypothetical protein